MSPVGGIAGSVTVLGHTGLEKALTGLISTLTQFISTLTVLISPLASPTCQPTIKRQS